MPLALSANSKARAQLLEVERKARESDLKAAIRDDTAAGRWVAADQKRRELLDLVDEYSHFGL